VYFSFSIIRNGILRKKVWTFFRLDGLCPDGFFNCYGDVIGTLDKLKKATLAFENFDYVDCSD
jgi:hypothetical protein